MRLGIVGSRSIDKYACLVNAIDKSPWSQQSVDTVVTGDADGVDSLAAYWARENDIGLDMKEPNWNDWASGHPAIERNTVIVRESNAVLAVWDGQSNGTRDSIDKALKYSKTLYVEVVDE